MGSPVIEIEAIRPLADTAITFDLAPTVGVEAAARARAAARMLEAKRCEGHMPGVVEITPAFRSITLHYDPLATSHDAVKAAAVKALTALSVNARRPLGRLWRLPCCYDAVHGLDLADLERGLGLPAAEIVEKHQDAAFHVYALGFLPGLPFMGDLPQELAYPRRSEPRLGTPAGSVAIAMGLSVIYPWESPGGWRIVGRCPAPLFDVARDPPALLSAGDRVRFEPIGLSALAALERDLASGARTPESFIVQGGSP